MFRLMKPCASPPTDIYLPPRSRLKFASSLDGTGESGRRHQVSMVGDELDKNLIRTLLCSANLQMPDQYVMKTLGTVSVKQNSTLISCLLFKRDETSEGIVIFDIVRLATKKGWQRRGYATRCLNALVDLLCCNFPGRKIVIRVGVLRIVSGFYKKAGFVKGMPKGLSEGRFCGQSDCDVHHLLQDASTSSSRSTGTSGNTAKIHDAISKQVSDARSISPRLLGQLKTQRKFPGQSQLKQKEPRKEKQQNIQNRPKKMPPTWLLQSESRTEDEEEEEDEDEDEEKEAEEEIETEEEEEDEDRPTLPRGEKTPQQQPKSPRPIASVDSSQTQNPEPHARPPLPSLAQRPQLQRPSVEIFCSSHSQTRVRHQANYDTPVSEVGQNRVDAIEGLLDRMGLIPLENMRKVGSVCVKIREEELVSCLLFIRDDASLATSTRIFDIARFTVGSDEQSQADATLCLEAFKTLLCQNFPCATIIVRAAVVEKAQSFYERAGFQKGVPLGISKGLYCGHSDCKTYHLVVQERHPTSATKKRKRMPEPARPSSMKPFEVQDRVVWRSKIWSKKKERDLTFGYVKKVNCDHDSKYRYFVKWDNRMPSWVDHKNLLAAVEVARRCSGVSRKKVANRG